MRYNVSTHGRPSGRTARCAASVRQSTLRCYVVVSVASAKSARSPDRDGEEEGRAERSWVTYRSI